jgi:hypothetical protein
MAYQNYYNEARTHLSLKGTSNNDDFFVGSIAGAAGR